MKTSRGLFLLCLLPLMAFAEDANTPPAIPSIRQALAEYEQTPASTRKPDQLAKTLQALEQLLPKAGDEDSRMELLRLLARTLHWQAKQDLRNAAWNQFLELLKKKKEPDRSQILQTEIKEAFAGGRVPMALMACVALQELTTDQPSRRFADFHRALCLFRSGDSQAAYSLLAQLADGKINDEWTAQAEFQMAIYYSRYRNTETAIARLRDFLKKYPQSPLVPAAKHFLAMNFYMNGQRYLALRTLQDLVAQHPSSEFLEPSQAFIERIKQEMLEAADPFE